MMMNKHQPKTQHDSVNDSPKRQKTRQCIVTREAHPSESMIRFVASPDDCIVPDYNNKLPGRGVWITKDASILAQGLHAKRFQNALKQKTVTLDRAGVVSQLRHQISKQIEAHIGLLRRTGALISGFENCMAAIKSNKPIGAYLTTAEGETDSRKKIRAACPQGIAEHVLSDKTGVDRVMGAENTTHIIVKRSDLCLKLLQHFENRDMITDLELKLEIEKE